MPEDRKSHTVWLKPRHMEMLEQLDISIGDLARNAIEEAFEGRHERDFAHICIDQGLSELTADWERTLGMISTSTVTATEDGFRIVVVALKQFNDG